MWCVVCVCVFTPPFCAPQVSLRQTAVCFEVLSPDGAGAGGGALVQLPCGSGSFQADRVLMIPETGQFDDLDIGAAVEEAKVR